MVKDNSFIKETEALRDLRALEAIERNPNVSQRELAKSMGVALGIVNACIHTLVRKGMVKIRGDNNRSISYHLTKRGIGMKSALAMQWTLNTIDFYREARLRVAHTLQRLSAEGVKRLLLYGANELAEIVIIASHAAGIEVVGVIGEPDSYISSILPDVPVGGFELVESTHPDAIAVTSIVPAAEVDAIKSEIREQTGFERVYGFFEDESGEADE